MQDKNPLNPNIHDVNISDIMCCKNPKAHYMTRDEFIERLNQITPPDLGGFGEGNAGGSSVRVEEGQALYKICKIFGPKKIIETGTHNGASTNYLLKYAQEDNATVYTFDISKSGQNILNELKKNLILINCQPRFWKRRVDDKQIHRVRNRLIETAADGVDLFFHDSDHRYENAKWEYDHIAPHMKRGQVVILHDVLYSTDMLQTRRLFDEIECTWKHIIETHNGLGVVVL